MKNLCTIGLRQTKICKCLKIISYVVFHKQNDFKYPQGLSSNVMRGTFHAGFYLVSNSHILIEYWNIWSNPENKHMLGVNYRNPRKIVKYVRS